METKDILESALNKLKSMTSKEVQKLSKEKGIEITKPKSTNDPFIIDLKGLFPEAINTK